jgi:hypothetical protein
MGIRLNRKKVVCNVRMQIEIKKKVGASWVMDKKGPRINHVDSMKNHGGDKMAIEPKKYYNMDTRMEIKVLTRKPYGQ